MFWSWVLLGLGLVFLVLSITWWTFISPLIISIIKTENFILDTESPLFAEWECSYRPNVTNQTPKYETFYVFNMLNMEEVRDQGAIPIYEEKGPYVYRANYTKFNIKFLENDIIEYKEKNTFYQDLDQSSGPDTELITNINPGYLGAAYIIGSESLMIQILAGPTIDQMIKDIKRVYIEGDLIPNSSFEEWLQKCIAIDPDCKDTNDMAIVQWGHYLDNFQGINNEDMNQKFPEEFGAKEAEYSSYIVNLRFPPEGNQISINSTKNLLYGEYGLVTNPENIELLLLSVGDDDEAFEKWGLTPGTARFFVQYILSIRTSYNRWLLDDLISQGSGLFTTRTVWEILWEDIDPLLVVLSPSEPYANIFFNYTTEEVADKLVGPYRINNGRSDRRKVEEISMWNGYEVVDIFWENVDIQVGGNSGNGQFAPTKLSLTGNTPEILDDILVWSEDHGRAVAFVDTGLKETLKGVNSHFYALINETYDPSLIYSLPERFKGFVNATVINEGVPVFYCQPRMWLVDQYWQDQVIGVQPPTWKDGSYIWIEPITGLAIKSDVKLQVNFYIPNSTTIFDQIYTNAPKDFMFPLVWTQQIGELTYEQADDLEKQLFDILNYIRIAWYIIFGLSVVLIISSVIVRYRNKVKGEYEMIN